MNSKEAMEAEGQTVHAEQLAEWVRKAQQLDRDAFAAIADCFSARLYGFLFRLSGSRDDAEEMVQEVFVRLVRTIGSYQHDGRFEAWLFCIASNLVRDRGRRKRRNPIKVSLGTDAEECDSVHICSLPSRSADSSPRDSAEYGEEVDRLEACLLRLSDPEREVILLRFYGSFSFAEVAEIMQTPMGTALARAHRGLSKLRSWME